MKKKLDRNKWNCVVPGSGGKDSTYQIIRAKELGLNPVFVTASTCDLSEIGRYNLENLLIKFDLDHVVFNASRKKINRVAKQSIEEIGDSCWHCHIGAGTFAIQSALVWKLNLLFYGEGPSDKVLRGSNKKN